ncbi:ABC transporter permease protein [Leptospirillum ferrooxidans C2-3]|uniref:Transport permease protein n=2 Tax=Leptospirillum ferrooxidans TaxID=180 RepID=I0IP34_LEPFC|nr:ABC transporter permease protein [Leptospirillum ferrooxidans C2-3]
MGNRMVEKASDDIRISLLSYPLWMTLGWQDIKQRYRRSSLGPLWITLSLGITVLTMGFLYAKLFHQDIHTYLPFLSVGMVFWALVSSLITDSTTVFIGAEGIIKQIPMPFGIHALRMIWKNIIIFLHNMVVVVAVMLFFGVAPGVNLLLFPLAVFLIMLNGFWVAILLGILGTRYRDISQVVLSVVQILFFITPVMWSPSSIQGKVWIMECNPLFHMMTIARNSLLGGPVSLGSWGVVAGMAALGWLVAFRMLVRYRSRIAYWL